MAVEPAEVPPADRFRAAVPWLGATAAALGLLVLLGWVAGVPALTTLVPGLSSMKVNTALGVVLSGVALVAATRAGKEPGWPRRAGPVASGVVVAIGALTLVEYGLAVDLGIDQALLRDPTIGPLNPIPGRMGANTAAALVLLGLAQLAATTREPQPFRVWASQLLAAAASLVALLALIGYLYSVASLVRVGSFTPMALHTAFAFALLVPGTLCLRPAEGFMRVFSRGGPTGRHARVLIAAAFAIPIARGAATIVFETSGALPDPRFADALGAAGAVVAFAVLLSWSAGRMQRQEAQLLEARVRLLAEERHSAAMREAHRAVEDSEAKLRAILDNTPSVVSLRDPGGRYVLVNRAFQATFGLDLGAVRGRTDDALFRASDAAAWRAHDLAVLERRAPVTSEETATLPGGRVATFLAVRFPILDSSGAVALLGSVRTDVTEAKAAEARRREAEQRAQEVLRLQDADRFKTQFINHISHELRTPLTPLQLQVHVLRARAPAGDEAIRRSLDVVARNVDLLEELLKRIVDAANLQARTLGLHRRPLDLADLVAASVAANQPAFAEAGLVLRLATGPGPVMVQGDPGRLGEVVSALLSNALHFSLRGGEVMVRVARTAAGAQVEVTDPGIGFRPEDGSRLFTPFTQVHDKAQHTGLGAGLGLFVAKGLVELHGGKVWASSPGPGQGATFGFALPLVDHDAPPEATAASVQAVRLTPG